MGIHPGPEEILESYKRECERLRTMLEIEQQTNAVLRGDLANSRRFEAHAQTAIESGELALSEWQSMKKLLRRMVAYREQAGPIGFQLEKFDEFLREADVILNQEAATL